MFFRKEKYGVKIVMGEFGAGKTYNVYYEAFIRKHSKENPFIIANVPYSFVDLVYTGTEDLKKIFSVLVEYARTTNTKNILEGYSKFRPIIFILDEAHLYFFSRWFAKNFDKDQLIILTQVRKRKISMYLITQELAQLDSTFRRLVPSVRKYYKGFGRWRWYVDYYLKKDETDVKNEEVADKVGGGPIFGAFMAPNMKARLTKLLGSKNKEFFKDYWTSYFITGFGQTLPSGFNLEYFKKLIQNKNENNTSTNTGGDKEKKKRTWLNTGKNSNIIKNGL